MVAIALFDREVEGNVCQAEKRQGTLETGAIYHQLVSERQKLRQPWQQKGQPQANAAAHGSQGRMAPLKYPLFVPQTFFFP
ncbi:MAG: hypothetical protein ABIF19_15010 [Planctomycetota bacterium]